MVTITGTATIVGHLPREATASHHQPSVHLQEARAICRTLGADELLYERHIRLVDARDPQADEFVRLRSKEWIQAIDEALRRIDRVARVAIDVLSTNDQYYTVWAELARVVSERTDLPELVNELCAPPLRHVGKSSRRNGAHEFCGPCPVCGGDDRFRVWGGPNGRAWCRQCGLNMDAIAFTRSFGRPDCREFRPAVQWLAERIGAPIGRR